MTPVTGFLDGQALARCAWRGIAVFFAVFAGSANPGS
jgi:hypothetical protein